MLKNNIAIIALPDRKAYSPEQRKHDLHVTGIDIEDAILSVLTSLTQTKPNPNPFEVHQELFELAQDHSWSKYRAGVLEKPLSEALYPSTVVDPNEEVKLSANVKQTLERLLLEAESFIAPQLPHLRRMGSPVAIEGFKRYPTIAVFNFITMNEKPVDSEQQEIEEGLNTFIDQLRKDNLESGVRLQLTPKPQPLVVDYVDAPITPKPIVTVPVDIIKKAVRSYTNSLSGVYENQDELDEDNLRLSNQLILLHKAGTEGLNYFEINRVFDITGYETAESLTIDTLLWYRKLDNLLSKIKNQYRDTSYQSACVFNSITMGLRALFLGKLYKEPKSFNSLKGDKELHNLFCKTLLDAESELYFTRFLARSRLSYGEPLHEVNHTLLLDPDKLTSGYCYSYRYDSIGDFNLTNSGPSNDRPLYFALQDRDWASPHLLGMYALKKTLLVFKVSKPKILLGQATQLEFLMNDKDFLAEIKENDSIFFTHVKDDSSNQGVLLPPHSNLIQVHGLPESIIQEYFYNLYNPLPLRQTILSVDYSWF